MYTLCSNYCSLTWPTWGGETCNERSGSAKSETPSKTHHRNSQISIFESILQHLMETSLKSFVRGAGSENLVSIELESNNSWSRLLKPKKMSWSWKSDLSKKDSDDSAWTPFNVHEMTLLETALTSGKRIKTVMINDTYAVDVEKMIQYRRDVRE